MNILNFMQRFPDEASCIAYLKEHREQSGVVCKHCGYMEHRWNAHKLSFECKHSHSGQSLRSGTVMEYSKLPFRYWIAAMFLLTATKKAFFTVAALIRIHLISHLDLSWVIENCRRTYTKKIKSRNKSPGIQLSFF